MTLYHFGNCLALVYVPYHLTYKFSGLSEYGAFWKCIRAGGMYVFTQVCKMLVLATFFPTNESGRQDSGDFFGDFLKSTVDLADLVGLYFVLASIPGKGHAKVLTAGVGWAGAELITTRCLVLWFGARGAEFHWMYIQKSLDSNISLVQHITTASLVWLWGRHDLNRSVVPLVTAMLVVCSYKPLFMDCLLQATASGPWVGLLLRLLLTLCLGTLTLAIYAGLAQTIGVY